MFNCLFIETQQNIKGAMVGLIQTPSYVAGMISRIVIGYILTARLLTRRRTVALGFCDVNWLSVARPVDIKI